MNKIIMNFGAHYRRVDQTASNTLVTDASYALPATILVSNCLFSFTEFKIYALFLVLCLTHLRNTIVRITYKQQKDT